MELDTPPTNKAMEQKIHQIVMEPDTSPINEAELNDENDPLELELASTLKKLLEEEHRRALDDAEALQRPLRYKIETREAQLDDDAELDKLFADYRSSLPDDRRPKSSRKIEWSRLFVKWHDNFAKELDSWKEELAELENQPIDKRLIFDSARERLMRSFRHEADAAGLWPQDNVVGESVSRPREAARAVGLWPRGNGVRESDSRSREVTRAEPADDHTPAGSVAASKERPLSALDELATVVQKPRALKLPRGQTVSIKSYIGLLAEIADYLIRNGQITRDDCPVYIEGSRTPLIDKAKRQYRSQRELPNGFFLQSNFSGYGCVERAVKLLERFGEDPSLFRVHLS